MDRLRRDGRFRFFRRPRRLVGAPLPPGDGDGRRGRPDHRQGLRPHRRDHARPRGRSLGALGASPLDAGDWRAASRRVALSRPCGPQAPQGPPPGEPPRQTGHFPPVRCGDSGLVPLDGHSPPRRRHSGGGRRRGDRLLALGAHPFGFAGAARIAEGKGQYASLRHPPRTPRDPGVEANGRHLVIPPSAFAPRGGFLRRAGPKSFQEACSVD